MATDPRVTKKRVTMTSYVVPPGAVPDEEGRIRANKHEAVDYVREDFLPEYLDMVRPNWQTVTVSDEYDAGPGGYEGATYVPEELDSPLAGQTFDATNSEG